MEKGIQVKVLLKGESARRFLKLKERYGLESNAETVRHMITEEYERVISRRA